MTLLRDIVSELVGMFLADARLTCTILILVVVLAGLISELGMDADTGGVVLTIGCLAILVEAAVREARKRKRAGSSSATE